MSTISAGTTLTTGLVHTSDTTGDLVIQTNGTTEAARFDTSQNLTVAGIVASSTGTLYPLKSDTAKTATGTSVDFTGIPSWVKRITVMFNGVSVSGSSNIQVQIGDSGGVENTGYVATAFGVANTGNIMTAASSTSGFPVTSVGSANNTIAGSLIISLQTGTTWVVNGSVSQTVGGTGGFSSGGTKTLSDVLDRVRITTVNGTDTFDAGTINILYE